MRRDKLNYIEEIQKSWYANNLSQKGLKELLDKITKQIPESPSAKDDPKEIEEKTKKEWIRFAKAIRSLR